MQWEPTFSDILLGRQVTMVFLPVITLCGVLLGWVVSSPVAHSPAGPVRGLLREQEDGGVSSSFLGIPYARPPVADLRFSRPQAHPRWEEIRNATMFGNMCMQNTSGLDVIWPAWLVDKYVRPLPIGEDCLTLNVYFPGNFTARDVRESLPVMVYIHGGGFSSGDVSGPLDDFQGLAMHGNVVVVSIQYRVGVFGFLIKPDDVASGNDGMYDQQLALQWVKHNIRAFGGDPDAVTLFGQSAGCGAIGYHLLNAASDDLYHKVICQSGAIHPLAAASVDVIISSTETLLDALNCSKPSVEESLACVREVSARDILDTQLELGLAFYPAADGVFLPNDPVESLKRGEFNKVPGIWGITVVEANMFVLGYDRTSFDRGLTELDVRFFIELLASTYTNSELVYDAIEDFYFPEGDMSDPMVNVDGVTMMMSDAAFRAPNGMMVDILAEDNSVDTFEYYFTHRPSFMPKRVYAPGAEHGDEIFFSEGKVSPSGVLYVNATEEERDLCLSVMTAWTSFAKTGRPVYLTSDGSSRPWPRFDLDERRYLEFSTNMNEENEKNNLLTENKYLWNEILPAIGGERKKYRDGKEK